MHKNSPNTLDIISISLKGGCLYQKDAKNKSYGSHSCIYSTFYPSYLQNRFSNGSNVCIHLFKSKNTYDCFIFFNSYRLSKDH